MSKLPVLNWINGQWLDSGNYKDSIDPATYASIGQYAEGGLNEASLDIEAAQQAFGHSPWKDDVTLRAQMLLELADAFERNAEALIELLALENGKSEVDARHLKRFGLELGGKTPMMVFADADLDAAIPVLVKALTVFAGQFCMTGSRLLVH